MTALFKRGDYVIAAAEGQIIHKGETCIVADCKDDRYRVVSDSRDAVEWFDETVLDRREAEAGHKQKFTVLLSATVRHWKRVEVTAASEEEAERLAVALGDEDTSLDGWTVAGESYPEEVHAIDVDPADDVFCVKCGGVMHQCATGDEGCLHCNNCEENHHASD